MARFYLFWHGQNGLVLIACWYGALCYSERKLRCLGFDLLECEGCSRFDLLSRLVSAALPFIRVVREHAHSFTHLVLDLEVESGGSVNPAFRRRRGKLGGVVCPELDDTGDCDELVMIPGNSCFAPTCEFGAISVQHCPVVAKDSPSGIKR